MSAGQILETWEINYRINLFLLNSISAERLEDRSASKGRSVGGQFAYIHNVRLMWLQPANPDLLKSQNKIKKETKLSTILLPDELKKSEKAITLLLQSGLDQGKIKGFKPHPLAFFGYLISHKSHHRGQIVICIKQSGHPVDKKILYGMWEWGVR